MMESEINQSSVSASENGDGIGATTEPGMKRRHQDPLGEDDGTNLPVADNSLNIGDELRKIHEKLDSQSVEIGSLKTQNKVLLAKVDLLQVQNAELHAKLKVSELEMKQTNEQMTKDMGTKMAEQIRQLAEKLDKAEEKIEGLGRKMDVKDKKLEQLENLAKQIDQGMADFGGKLATLESQTAADQNKLEEMRKTLEVLNLSKFVWNNNKWHISSDQKWVQITADGRTVTNTNKNDYRTNVRAQQPFSRAMLALIPGQQKLVYWEMSMKKEFASCIGWIGPNISLSDNKWIVEHPSSFGIDIDGDYWESGSISVEGYGEGFGEGDVVGSGLLLTRDHRLKLFFTKNGALNGEPVVLKDDQDLLLNSAVSIFRKDASVEANFGADPAVKPFMFDINFYKAELFD